MVFCTVFSDEGPAFRETSGMVPGLGPGTSRCSYTVWVNAAMLIWTNLDGGILGFACLHAEFRVLRIDSMAALPSLLEDACECFLFVEASGA